MKPLNEQELLKRAHDFEEEALAEIYDRWSPALYRYSLRLLGETHLAEECVSETFSRFLAALQQDSGPREHIQAYLYRVAHNWITDLYRRTTPAILPLVQEMKAEAGDEPPQLSARETERQQVRAALKLLTPDQRQVVMLKFMEDWDNEMIARALDKPIGAVKALQHRALESLRRILTASEKKES
jgi:RNA polymerase sigma-70 factor (ECF subfamily)